MQKHIVFGLGGLLVGLFAAATPAGRRVQAAIGINALSAGRAAGARRVAVASQSDSGCSCDNSRELPDAGWSLGRTPPTSRRPIGLRPAVATSPLGGGPPDGGGKGDYA